MPAGAAWQGGIVWDLNADAQIGAGGGIEIAFIDLVRSTRQLKEAIIVPRQSIGYRFLLWKRLAHRASGILPC
jgi:hypothetical protein